MDEVCFCGREGEIEDREPVALGDGDWGLACPRCGHLDRLEGWSEAARRWVLAEAVRRHGSEVGPAVIARPGLAA